MYILSTIIDDGGDCDIDKANLYIGLWLKNPERFGLNG